LPFSNAAVSGVKFLTAVVDTSAKLRVISVFCREIVEISATVGHYVAYCGSSLLTFRKNFDLLIFEDETDRFSVTGQLWSNMAWGWR
jgi:hypothetical protein